jgi:hypothetical protein
LYEDQLHQARGFIVALTLSILAAGYDQRCCLEGYFHRGFFRSAARLHGHQSNRKVLPFPDERRQLAGELD